jgi:hypothetical protein
LRGPGLEPQPEDIVFLQEVLYGSFQSLHKNLKERDHFENLSVDGRIIIIIN